MEPFDFDEKVDALKRVINISNEIINDASSFPRDVNQAKESLKFAKLSLDDVKKELKANIRRNEQIFNDLKITQKERDRAAFRICSIKENLEKLNIE